MTGGAPPRRRWWRLKSRSFLQKSPRVRCCQKVAPLCYWREDVCRLRAFRSESGLIRLAVINLTSLLLLLLLRAEVRTPVKLCAGCMQMAQTSFNREAVWETTGRAHLGWIVLQFNWFGKQTESFSEILADYQAAVQGEKEEAIKIHTSNVSAAYS